MNGVRMPLYRAGKIRCRGEPYLQRAMSVKGYNQ